MKYSHDYVSTAYVKLLSIKESDDLISFNQHEKQEEKILFVAPGYIPTLQLSFIKTNEIKYAQLGCDYVPWLSIIDVLMFNEPAVILDYLNNYELI